MAITVRDLLVKLGVQADTAAVSQFDAAVGSAAKVMAVAAGAALALAGALTASAVATARQGDEAAKAAARVGITAEEMQELGFAAQQTGAELVDVETAFRRQARAADDATKGTGRAADTYRKLGVSVKDATGRIKEPLPLFLESAEAIKNLGTETEKSAVANDLFGRGGAKILPLLNAGSAGINALREEAQSLGFVLGEDATKASEDFIDRLNESRLVVVGLRNQIGMALLPVMTSLLETFRDFIRVNGQLIRQRIDRFMERRILPAVNFLRRAFEKVDEVVRERIGGWPVLFQQVEKVGRFVATSAGLAGLIKLARAAQLAMLALFAPGAPVILGVAALTVGIIALVLAGEDLLVFARGGESAIGSFLEKMDPALAERLRDALRDLGEEVADLGAIFTAVSDSIGVDLSSVEASIIATFGKLALFEIKRFTLTIEAMVSALGVVPDAIDTIADTIASLIEIMDPFLDGLEKIPGLGGLAETLRSAAGQRRTFAGEGGLGGVVAEDAARRERGREVMAFRGAGGTAAVAAETQRQNREAEQRFQVNQGSTTIQINGAGDPAAVGEEVRRAMDERDRQAFDALRGGFT